MMKSTLSSHQGWVVSVQWSPTDQHQLLSGSYDSTLRVWDIRSTKQPLFTITAHEGKVLCCDWTLPNVSLTGEIIVCHFSLHRRLNTVEPRYSKHLKCGHLVFADRLFRNGMYLHRQLYKSPSEVQTPRYSIKRTLGMAPTISPPIQTHPYSGHFANKFVDSLDKQQEELKALNSTRTARYQLSVLLVYYSFHVLYFKVTGHIASLEIALSHTHIVSITPEMRTPR